MTYHDYIKTPQLMGIWSDISGIMTMDLNQKRFCYEFMGVQWGIHRRINFKHRRSWDIQSRLYHILYMIIYIYIHMCVCVCEGVNIHWPAISMWTEGARWTCLVSTTSFSMFTIFFKPGGFFVQFSSVHSHSSWSTRHCYFLAGWWFGTSILFSHILEISSSQLTHIFSEGWPNHQPVVIFWFRMVSISDMICDACAWHRSGNTGRRNKKVTPVVPWNSGMALPGDRLRGGSEGNFYQFLIVGSIGGFHKGGYPRM